jgi:carbon storage regulator CsrA
MIGNNITILISRVSGKRVTLGLEAPKEIRIRRAELGPELEPELERTTPAVDAGQDVKPVDEGNAEDASEDDLFPSGRMVVSLVPHPFALL